MRWLNRGSQVVHATHVSALFLEPALGKIFLMRGCAANDIARSLQDNRRAAITSSTCSRRDVAVIAVMPLPPALPLQIRKRICVYPHTPACHERGPCVACCQAMLFLKIREGVRLLIEPIKRKFKIEVLARRKM